jgi:hypothetical protein
MYEFILRENRSDIYDIYMDGKRIRDENDFCVKIDEENKRVLFYNAYTAHSLVETDEILAQLIDILKLITANDLNGWEVTQGYNYVINTILELELAKAGGNRI